MVPADPDLGEFITAPPIIATFNFTDLSNGTGTRYFYLAQANSATTAKVQILTQDATLYSFDEGREINFGTTAREFELTEFNLEQTIKGTATLTCEISSSAGQTFTVQLKKNGTNFGTAATITHVVTLTQYRVLLPIPTQENFKRGDVLSVHFSSSAGTAIRIGTDPTNAASTNVTNTKSTLAIPFLLPNQ